MASSSTICLRSAQPKRRLSAFALGVALTERAYLGLQTDDASMDERQRLRRVARALPDDAPDRLVDTAMAVCACDVGGMFSTGLDLIIRDSR